MNIQKAINLLGWILWALVYGGLIDAALWYLLVEKSVGSGFWELHPTVWTGYLIVGAVAFATYTVIMLFIKMLFDALAAKIVHTLSKAQKSVEKLKNDLVNDANADRLREGSTQGP